MGHNSSKQRASMSKIKAIVFDIDRTLLDTKAFISEAYIHTIKTHKLPLSLLNDLDSHMGKTLETEYQMMAPKHNLQELIETHRSFQEKNFQLSVPFPNTLQTLKTLQNRGIKLAAVTNRSKRTSDKTLKLAGLTPFFEVILSKEDLPFNELKPHPRPVLLALERMNIHPENAFMVGDSREDIEAGKRAGTRTVGATYGSLGKEIAASKPDHTIDDIAELISLVINPPVDKSFRKKL